MATWNVFPRWSQSYDALRAHGSAAVLYIKQNKKQNTACFAVVSVRCSYSVATSYRTRRACVICAGWTASRLPPRTVLIVIAGEGGSRTSVGVVCGVTGGGNEEGRTHRFLFRCPLEGTFFESRRKGRKVNRCSPATRANTSKTPHEPLWEKQMWRACCSGRFGVGGGVDVGRSSMEIF